MVLCSPSAWVRKEEQGVDKLCHQLVVFAVLGSCGEPCFCFRAAIDDTLRRMLIPT
jgi:hypothetical protein